MTDKDLENVDELPASILDEIFVQSAPAFSQKQLQATSQMTAGWTASIFERGRAAGCSLATRAGGVAVGRGAARNAEAREEPYRGHSSLHSLGI